MVFITRILREFKTSSERNYLLDISNKDQRCPYCKALQQDDLKELIIDKNISNSCDKNTALSPKSEIEEYANYIQKVWRGHRQRKIFKNARNF